MKNFPLPDHDSMYRALVNKDSHFEGIFWVGVKTTGIFCRPSCTARKPKKENVEFFGSQTEALQLGYRPCKICSPMFKQGEIPHWLEPLIGKIQLKQDLRIKDADLRDLGLDPPRVRRWFKKNYNMTFQGYLRTLRISSAFGRIKFGEPVLDTALDSGYESLSGFADSFKQKTGFSPKKSRDNKLVVVTRILTPLGPMMAGAVEEGICLLEFIDRRMLETQIEKLKRYFKSEFLPGEHHHFQTLNEEISAYFDGKLRQFKVPLALTGTDFQRKVWQELRSIPYGTTRSYGQQAGHMGNPAAVRAVAKANGDNPIAIIVPCHRVIGADGQLVGYGGGLWRKKYLLNLEKRNKT